jgi:DNA-binding CsgD family transcriptional regulator
VIRLKSATLSAAHDFLLDINGTTDPDDLRSRIPAGLSRLIACDRASLTEVDLTKIRQRIVPNPVPAWWARLGGVYQAHFLDHPVFSKAHAPKLNQTISIGDRCFAASWGKAALYHEYFLPLGMKHQLCAAISRKEGTMVAIATNRAKTDFAPDDRALLDLLNPHIAQAWQNALSFAALRHQAEGAQGEVAREQAVIAVDGGQARMRPISARASYILRKYFAADSDGNAHLPEQLDRWLRAQRTHLATPDGVCAPPQPLVVKGPTGRLVVQLARTCPDEVILLLDATEDSTGHKGMPLTDLTPREDEILAWITEGKRSPEIAVILGISVRTVEKHVEHILMKLGVETRSAAIHEASKLRRTHDARFHHG